MLSLMRKHAGSWMIKIILFAIVVVFVFWGVGSMRSRQATRVAEINGEVIPLEIYQKAYYRLMDNYRRIYGDQLTDDVLKMLRPNEMALEQLIQRILMLQEADRLDIDVTEQELAASIRQVPAFQNNGVFSYQRYRQVLAQNNLAVEQFEGDRISDIRLEKLQAVVLSGVTVSEDEMRQWYNWNNASVDLDYVVFSADQYQDISPSDEEIKQYFDTNQQRYLTEPQVRVRYLKFDPADYAAQVSITDEDISNYYYANPEAFKTQKRVNASHILISLDSDADADTVAAKREEAQKVYELASAEGADFAELAKQHSQGPSAENGGRLGWFTRDRMVAPFADKAFAMNPGDISEPVRTRFGWHIIKVDKVEAATTKSLESSRQTIRDQLIEKRTRTLAMDKAEEVYNSVFDGDDLSVAAKAHGLEADVTEFFSESRPPLKQIAQPQRFARSAFLLEPMAISEIQDFSDGFFILQVTERRDPAVPEYESVRETVKADLIEEKQDARAQKAANAMLADLENGVAFAAAAKSHRVTAQTTGPFKRGGSIPRIGAEAAVSQAAFELSAEDPLPQSAIKGQRGWYVIRFKDRQLPDQEAFEKEKTTISERLQNQKRQAALQAWLADLRANSDVEINAELIQQ